MIVQGQRSSTGELNIDISQRTLLYFFKKRVAIIVIQYIVDNFRMPGKISPDALQAHLVWGKQPIVHQILAETSILPPV